MAKTSPAITPRECVASLHAVSDALYVIGGKWKLRIIIALSEGNKRFSQLQRTVTGISARVLSKELKELELNGFVVRKVHAGSMPVLVEYERTGYADSLREVLAALTAWGTAHRAKLRRQAKQLQEMGS